MELSKEEILHLLKKEISDNLILNKKVEELENRYTELVTKWNNLQCTKDDIGVVNSWLRLKDFFETDHRIKNHYNNKKEECMKDRSFGIVTHMIETLDMILDLLE